jgi:hypothetical protein
MSKNRKPNSMTSGHVIGGVIFILIMIGLVLFAAGYDPETPYSTPFFDNVANAVQWR